MFSVTGPVISRPSAWRGEATNWMPKRPRSQPTVLSTLTSASQALQPPALTWRSLQRAAEELPAVLASSAAAELELRWSGRDDQVLAAGATARR